MSSSPASSIQTRTLLWSSPGQVPMTHNLRFRKENLQIPEKVNESRFLLSGHGVLPPLKLRPVISKHYIDTWYHASQMVLRASKIIILGYSFSSADNYFCDMLRENHDAQIIIIDKNMEHGNCKSQCVSLPPVGCQSLHQANKRWAWDTQIQQSSDDYWSRLVGC